MHCALVYCVDTVEESVELWVEESGVRAEEPVERGVYSDIVQRSASESFSSGVSTPCNPALLSSTGVRESYCGGPVSVESQAQLPSSS